MRSGGRRWVWVKSGSESELDEWLRVEKTELWENPRGVWCVLEEE